MDSRPVNRLAHERSPYLLQHAHNPVDWNPWGDEAFDNARTTDRPVFLSVGYSACHWCHVMERESFEDPATAAFLNEHFVSVKVDREERPDVDQVYQLAHQVMAQRAGGWPLSMFLTPDRRPFFGGTYFPNARRHGMPSFLEVLHAVLDAWKNRRDDVAAQSDEVTAYVSRVTTGSPTGVPGDGPDTEVLPGAVRTVLARADKTFGGFGAAPRFPNTMTLDLLVTLAATREGPLAREARDHVALTLGAMDRGGIHDHLGGGFARYSTDTRWRVPHFEKMLYDNAQLARAYLDGWRLLAERDPQGLPTARCRAVVADVVTYLLREMTAPDGTFYSAQDADSEGEEGRYFVWDPAGVEAVVGPADAPAVCGWFDVTAEGNFEHGRSVLWTPRPLSEVAASLGCAPEAVTHAVDRARPLLFAARSTRPRPALDEKSLAAWNALVIGMLADAGATLGEPAWVTAAQRALTVWRTQAFRDGRLHHAMKHGEAYGTGYLDDYAGLAGAAVDVWEATGDPDALAFARSLGDAVIDRFHDAAARAFCYTPSDAEVVLVRARDAHDHAYPGGVGLCLDALLRLATVTGEARYRSVADSVLEVLAPMARENPMGVATVVRAVDRAARGAVEVIVVGDGATEDTRALCVAARSVALPHRALVSVRDADDARRQGIDPALVEGRTAAADGSPRAYVCRGTACELPVTTPEALVATLRRAVVRTGHLGYTADRRPW